jgi:hypothetical protein
MQKRAAKWLMLVTLSAPTLYVGCPANIGLEVLNAVMTGVYSGAQTWGARATLDFLEDLQAQAEQTDDATQP